MGHLRVDHCKFVFDSFGCEDQYRSSVVPVVVGQELDGFLDSGERDGEAFCFAFCEAFCFAFCFAFFESFRDLVILGGDLLPQHKDLLLETERSCIHLVWLIVEVE
jgi:hypothetical protein